MDTDEKQLDHWLDVWAKKEGVESAAKYWKDRLAGPPFFVINMSALERRAQSLYWDEFLKGVAETDSSLAIHLREWNLPKGKGLQYNLLYSNFFSLQLQTM
jgi:hypothetical protein